MNPVIKYLIHKREEHLLNRYVWPSGAYIPLAAWNSLRKEVKSFGVEELVPPRASNYVNGSLRFMGMKVFIGRLK